MSELQETFRDRLLRQKAGSQPSPAQAHEPFVSIIVLNCNGEAILPRCLDSLLNQSYSKFEVIVFDNGSTDASKAAVDSYLQDKRVRFVGNHKNLGVAGGRNAALKHARGSVIAFIDNDGYAKSDWLEEAVAKLFSDSDVGAVGSLVFFNRNKLVVNGAGGSISKQWYAADILFNEPYENSKLPEEILYPMGCGMLIRREVMSEIGPLDTYSPKWFDDTELGVRCWLAGKRVLLAERAIVDHDFHTSEKALQIPAWKQALSYERMRIRMAFKYQPYSSFPTWLGGEFLELLRECFGLRFPQAGTLLFALGQNIVSFKSAYRIRKSFNIQPLPERLYRSQLKEKANSLPKNHLLEIKVPTDGALCAKDPNAKDHFHYGCEHKSAASIQTIGQASFVFLLEQETRELNVSVKNEAPFDLHLRLFGSEGYIRSFSFKRATEMTNFSRPLSLASGFYEVLVIPEVPMARANFESIEFK